MVVFFFMYLWLQLFLSLYHPLWCTLINLNNYWMDCDEMLLFPSGRTIITLGICSYLRAVRPHGSQTSGQVKSQIHLCCDSLALTQSVFTNINSFPSNSTNPSGLSSNLCYQPGGECLASLHRPCCGKPITENKEMTSVFNFLNS